MRLSTWTATSTSVTRRSSVCERSPSPITRLNRLIAVSARARFVYPDALCHALRPCSAMSWRWRSRGVGSLSAVRLGTAVAGRDDDGRCRMALADADIHAILIIRPVACDGGDSSRHVVEQGANLRAVISLAAC